MTSLFEELDEKLALEKESFAKLQTALGKDIAMNAAINHFMDEIWNKKPIVPDPLDLNPHLEVIEIVNSVIKKVEEVGLTCTSSDVMLSWLSNSVHYGIWMPNKSV